MEPAELFSFFSVWAKKCLVPINTPKSQFFFNWLNAIIQIPISHSSITHKVFFYTLNFLGLSLPQNQTGSYTYLLLDQFQRGWAFCIVTANSLLPELLLAIYNGLICLCMEYESLVWSTSIQIAFLNKLESHLFRFVSFPPLFDCSPSIKLQFSVTCLSLFKRYFHTICSF